MKSLCLSPYKKAGKHSPHAPDALLHPSELSALCLTASNWQPNAFPLSQNIQDDLKHDPPTDTVSAQKGTCSLQQLFAYLLLSCSMVIFFLALVWWTSQLGPGVVAQSSKKRTDPRASFPFSLPAVFSFFLFYFFSFLFWLTQGWSKGAYLINPFQTGRLCNFITGQNYYEQLKLEILFDTKKFI